jgi:glycine cleavage system protein P-like pyridoxal-binding family
MPSFYLKVERFVQVVDTHEVMVDANTLEEAVSKYNLDADAHITLQYFVDENTTLVEPTETPTLVIFDENDNVLYHNGIKP